MKHRAERFDGDRDLDEIMDSAAASEGLDDELVRQCRSLLAEEPAATGKPHARRKAGFFRARRHLLVARLAFEVNAPDRVHAEIQAALTHWPDEEAALRLAGAAHHRQGQLTLAVTIWQQLAMRAEVTPSALDHLMQVFALCLREGTDRHRQLPAGLETALHQGLADLEHAFRLGLSNNLPGALRIVDRIVTRFRSTDRHVYKVAVLQRAFLLQQANDIRSAIASLEQVADEPGFANDAERLLCLSELYEREGTPERIRRAIRAVRYAYTITRRPPLLRRLARLLSRLGHNRLAELFEARYLEIFRRKMHGLSLRELVAAATTWYVPTDRLRVLVTDAAAASALLGRCLARNRPVHQRRAAVLSLLLGDAAHAALLLSRLDNTTEASPVDLMYLAEARELAGDSDAARTLRLRAIQSHPQPDSIMLFALVGPDAARESDLHAALPTANHLEQAVRVLEAHTRAAPASALGFTTLARVEHALGRNGASREHAAHAQALRQPHRPSQGPIVLAAAALRVGGETVGLIHELWVETRRKPRGGGGMDPADVLGSVTPELRGQAVSIFYAVRAFARMHFPHRVSSRNDIGFSIRFTKDDEISSGDSAGLPMAVAFLATLLELPVPHDVAMSGAIVCDAHDVVMVRRVGDVDAKIEGAFERRLRRLVLPAGNLEDVERAERIPRDVARRLVVYVATLQDVCRELFPEVG